MNDQPPNKKRKISLDKISLPRLKTILYLLCDICGERVYDYKTSKRQNDCIYCSYDCLSVLMLNNMNNQENATYET